MAPKLVGLLDRGLRGLMVAGRTLALPVVALLFLQWPLRDGLGRWSREANDLGQWIFALYVALSVAAATRAGRHLSADLFAHRWSDLSRRRIAVVGLLAGVLPWAGFVLWKGWIPAWRSILGLENFPDTYNPGYFLIKAALLVLAATIALQAVVDLVRLGGRR